MRTISVSLVLAAAVSGCVGMDDELELSSVESNSSVYQWSNDVRTGGRSGYQPGLAYNGQLHMLSTNMDTINGVPSHWLMWQRFTGTSWTSPVWTGQVADYGPALAMFRGQLVAIYHAASQNRLVMTTSDGVNGWTTPVNAGTTLNSTTLRYAPAIATRGTTLYAAYCTHDSAGDHVRIDRYATAWTTAAQLDVVGTCKHVALAAEPDGRLRLLYNVDLTSVWELYETRDNGFDASSWTTPTALTFRTKKPPSMTTCNNVTHMVHGGYSSPSEIWWTDRENGRWIPDQKVPDQVSDGGAALGCYGRRAIMVHNGGYDDLWWSEFLP